MDMKKPKILLITEAANPEWTSVPLVGWSISQAISKIADVHIVTQIRNRDAFLRAGLAENRDFTSIDSEFIGSKLWRIGSFLRGGKGKGWTTVQVFSAFSYYYFEHLIWKEFAKRIKKGEFDIVHRITPLSPTIPSLIAKKCKDAGVPFVVGPLNGGLPWPKGYDSVRIKEKEWFSYIRSAYRFLPGYRSTLKNASAIIVGSIGTYDQIPEKYHSKCIYIPENGIDEKKIHIKRKRNAELPLKAVFMGRLVPYKGADMLIEAVIPLIKKGLLELEIIGDGPQRSELENIAKENKLENSIRFAGWIKHEFMQGKLSEFDIFVFPSIREFGGAVVLEAMSAGLVPIVVAYGGPGEIVTPETGFLIKMGPRKNLIESFYKKLLELSGNASIIDFKRNLAAERARNLFAWSIKAAQVLKVYDWVLGRAKKKPDFGMPLKLQKVV